METYLEPLRVSQSNGVPSTKLRTLTCPKNPQGTLIFLRVYAYGMLGTCWENTEGVSVGSLTEHFHKALSDWSVMSISLHTLPLLTHVHPWLHTLSVPLCCPSVPLCCLGWVKFPSIEALSDSPLS